MHDIASLADELRAQGERAGHRRMLVLQGPRTWCVPAARAAVRGETVWVASDDCDGVERLWGRAARWVLGRDIDSLVIDLHGGLDADALGATVGAVRAGGLVVLMAPEQAAEGRFERRFFEALRRAEGCTWLTPGGVEQTSQPGPDLRGDHQGADGPCRTADQAAAADLVEALGHARAPAPVVLVADRGRGKSSALGIAAGRLLEGEGPEVVVTGPSQDATLPVFARAREILGVDDPRLVFRAPAEILAAPEPDALLLVDEAAALAVPTLVHLLQHHPRVAFATTVHGYEGTGMGFAVRFRGVLDRRPGGWEEQRLTEPIRWAAGDPVEAFAFDALLLGAEPTSVDAVADARPTSCTFRRLDRDELAADEPLLRELFGLLVLAHYRTTPSDLGRFLDAPNLSVFAAQHEGRVVGAAVVAAEGGLGADEAEALVQGRARPSGQMLPEILATHLGNAAGAGLRSARVVRIAVHPAAQRRGLGRALIEAVADDARGAALLGSGFGVTAPLLRFWSDASMETVRIGIRRGAASGIRSAVVLRGLTEEGRALVRRESDRLAQELPHLLGDPLRDLDPDVVEGLRAGPAPTLCTQDIEELSAFAFGPRISDVTVGPIWRLVLAARADKDLWSAQPSDARRLLVAKVLQKRPWSELTRALGFTHRNEATRALRAAVLPLLEALGGDGVEQARRRFS